jgi:hypothetical protein
MRGDPTPHDLPPAVAHDQQPIEQSERDCRNHEKVHRRDTVSMVAKESPPLCVPKTSFELMM